MDQKIVELVQELEKFPHVRERLEIMLSVAKNSSGEYDLADDVEMKICEEISKMGLELMEAWGANQEAVKSSLVLKNNKSIIHHSKKKFIGIQNLEK